MVGSVPASTRRYEPPAPAARAPVPSSPRITDAMCATAGVLRRQPAEVASRERALGECLPCWELAVEVQEERDAPRQRRVTRAGELRGVVVDRRRVPEWGSGARSRRSCGRRRRGCPRSSTKWQARQFIDCRPRTARGTARGWSGACRRRDRPRERPVHVAAGVRLEELREAGLEEESLADRDLGRIASSPPLRRRLVRATARRARAAGGRAASTSHRLASESERGADEDALLVILVFAGDEVGDARQALSGVVACTRRRAGRRRAARAIREADGDAVDAVDPACRSGELTAAERRSLTRPSATPARRGAPRPAAGFSNSRPRKRIGQEARPEAIARLEPVALLVVARFASSNSTSVSSRGFSNSDSARARRARGPWRRSGCRRSG